MIEQHIILEGIDAVSFYGANNTHLMMLKKLFPKLRIVARDYIIKAVGDEEELDKFRAVVDRLIDHCTRYNSIDEEAIIDAVNGKKSDKGSDSNVIVYNINGKPIYPRSENQCKLVEEFGKNDMIFCSGPRRNGKDLHSNCSCSESVEKPRNTQDYPQPSGSGGRRKAWISARRHAREN